MTMVFLDSPLRLLDGVATAVVGVVVINSHNQRVVLVNCDGGK